MRGSLIKGFVMAGILLPLLSFQPLYAQESTVNKGILDLRNIKPGTSFSVRMNGEWEFWFRKYLDPGDQDSLKNLRPDCYGKVPSYWTSYIVDGKKLPGLGYGTYRCTVYLPAGFNDRLGFDMPIFDTSYEMFINGVAVAKNGVPGRTKEESSPAYEPTIFIYNPKADTLNIIIHIANFSHLKGGFWMPMKIGSFRTIQKSFANHWFYSIAISSILFAAFVFFMLFSLFDRRNLKLFMFAVLTLALAIKPFFTSTVLISTFNVHNWNFIVKAEYFTLFLMLAAGTRLIYFIYKTRFFRFFALAIDILFVVAVIMIIITPVYFIAHTDIIINLTALILAVYALTMSIRGTLRKNWTDFIYLFALAAMGIGIVADIFTSMAKGSYEQNYILSSLMIIFVGIQASLLIREWVGSMHEKEKLHEQLEEMNMTLEERVAERTRELIEKHEEVRIQSQRIALQNKKLSDALVLKNKIFSVISHDLRSPVVNILYTLNLMKEEEFRDKSEVLATSCIQYSQMVINLLENMLVWGRGQEDMIRYAPGEFDMADIILTNMSILKDTADRKNISLNFTQMGRSKGWFDKDLMDIIIRNLLSNAIKYTYQGGKVSINLRERLENGDGMIIRICDNGMGISEERQKLLFTGAEIDTTSGTANEKGTGLGLKLVHELVTISKGSISVESTPGNGSCFTVSLPGKNNKRSF